jgi:hypothetical protein
MGTGLGITKSDRLANAARGTGNKGNLTGQRF